MSNYTATAMGTVLVAVAGAELNRFGAIKYNEDHPHYPEYDPKRKSGKQKRKVTTVMHPVIAGFTLGLFLFALGMAHEDFATLLCLLIVVGSFINNGELIFNAITPK
jgi:hypothetical protein